MCNHPPQTLLQKIIRIVDWQNDRNPLTFCRLLVFWHVFEHIGQKSAVRSWKREPELSFDLCTKFQVTRNVPACSTGQRQAQIPRETAQNQNLFNPANPKRHLQYSDSRWAGIAKDMRDQH